MGHRFRIVAALVVFSITAVGCNITDPAVAPVKNTASEDAADTPADAATDAATDTAPEDASEPSDVPTPPDDASADAPSVDVGADTAPADTGDDAAPADDGGTDAPACSGAQQLCGSSCVDTNSNTDHCGGCDQPCTAPAHASVLECASGDCVFECDADWYDLNGDLQQPTSDGCESDCQITNGGVEICDEIDNDCDGAVDEGVQTTYYEDTDDDGYGTSTSVSACSPSGDFTATQDGDCDDTASGIHPGATQFCSGNIDQDCDGDVACADSDCTGKPCLSQGGHATCQGGSCVADDCNTLCATDEYCTCGGTQCCPNGQLCACR